MEYHYFWKHPYLPPVTIATGGAAEIRDGFLIADSFCSAVVSFKFCLAKHVETWSNARKGTEAGGNNYA